MKRYIDLLAAIGIVIVIFGTIYGAVQQAQRRDANYPQIQLAQDTATQIDSNKDPHIASLFTPVDISKSLAPFVIVYDQKGNVVSGSGYLGKEIAKVPLDVLQASRGKAYDAVTWQPESDVRIASVTVAAKSYYVMSGRSLAEVEKNENHTLLIAGIGCILSLLIIGVSITAKLIVDGRAGRH